MDGNTPFPDGQSLEGPVRIAAPLEQNVVGPGSDHREQNQQWQEITDQTVFKPRCCASQLERFSPISTAEAISSPYQRKVMGPN